MPLWLVFGAGFKGPWVQGVEYNADLRPDLTLGSLNPCVLEPLGFIHLESLNPRILGPLFNSHTNLYPKNFSADRNTR